jgi:hypothetical protein
MLATPSMQPPERRLSDIDRFCIQTQEAGEKAAARRVRFVASTLGVVCLGLLAALGAAVWQTNAVAQERDALAQELRLEREARMQATLAATDAEMSAANRALDTRVRSDMVDERMLEQQRRSAELAQLAQDVERQKLVKANCVTPRSLAAGL